MEDGGDNRRGGFGHLGEVPDPSLLYYGDVSMSDAEVRSDRRRFVPHRHQRVDEREEIKRGDRRGGGGGDSGDGYESGGGQDKVAVRVA